MMMAMAMAMTMAMITCSTHHFQNIQIQTQLHTRKTKRARKRIAEQGSTPVRVCENVSPCIRLTGVVLVSPPGPTSN